MTVKLRSLLILVSFLNLVSLGGTLRPVMAADITATAALTGEGGAPPWLPQTCTDATHDSANNAILICEDFEGAVSCTTSYSSNCRLTWTVDNATPDYDYATSPAPLEGSYSLFLSKTGGTAVYKTITVTGSAYFFFLYTPVDSSISGGLSNRVAKIWDSGYVRQGIFDITQPTDTLYWAVQATGGTYQTSSSTPTVGTTYCVWGSYTKGTGANATASLWVAPLTGGSCTKPGSPTISSTDGTGTDDPYLFEMMGGDYISGIYDHVRVGAAAFGSNPP